MTLLTLILSTMALLLAGYFIYGFFLKKIFRLLPDTKTPAYQFQNNLDFVPAGKFYLLGQHLSAIAAAGPIIGPILAGMWFGWVPAILWIIFGGIFIGGVHDMGTLVASIRHQGKSIAEVIHENVSRHAYILFLLFLWFSLVYIITSFTDITASTFVDETMGPKVASSSMMYLIVALVMGIILKKIKTPLFATTLIFLPLVFLSVYLGPFFPLKVPALFGLDAHRTWNILLLVYCFFASVIPVWLLLQPRGYLGGFFLIITAGVSVVGMIVGSFVQNLVIQYPAFTGWVSPHGLPLFPILFTTVACGACSGFHAIVSSGTTSKQISKETDAKLVGYGGMLLESFVAIIALGTLLLLSPREAVTLRDPNHIYANGIAIFLNNLGIDRNLALNFALLAFATFVYDTLDVATRLGRYIFQELTGWRGRLSPYVATFVTLILPAIFVTRKMLDGQGNEIAAWKMLWTVFGSSNQLLAGLVLFAISIWLFRNRMKWLFAILPSIFMIAVAFFSLYIILKDWIFNIIFRHKFTPDPIGITGLILLVLSLLLITEGLKVFLTKRKNICHEK